MEQRTMSGTIEESSLWLCVLGLASARVSVGTNVCLCIWNNLPHCTGGLLFARVWDQAFSSAADTLCDMDVGKFSSTFCLCPFFNEHQSSENVSECFRGDTAVAAKVIFLHFFLHYITFLWRHFHFSSTFSEGCLNHT